MIPAHIRDLYIAYTLIDWLTPARLRQLRERFGTAEQISSATVADLATTLRVPEGRAKLVKNPLHNTEVSDTVTRWRDRVIAFVDGDASALLREIPDPPPALYFHGNRALINAPAIGIVGSRHASRYGLAVAERLGFELSRLGVTVVSGLARGIDQAAHRGAIRERGSTIAVLGTGIDVDYPRGCRSLRAQIEQGGLIVSEFAPSTPPRPANFPVRNRIISGLSLGVVVVEATPKSGSLITARLAAEQNREVFAVPGSIFNKASEGPHRLIHYGAKLVHDLDDILEEVRLSLPATEREEMTAPAGLPGLVLEHLRRDEAIHVDSIATLLKTSHGELAAALLELEMAGVIRAVPGGRWVRSPI